MKKMIKAAIVVYKIALVVVCLTYLVHWGIEYMNRPYPSECTRETSKAIFIEELFDENGDEAYSEEVEETEFFHQPCTVRPEPFLHKSWRGV